VKFSESFELPLSPDAAYELLLDLDTVVPCVPGAAVGAEQPDGGRELTMAVKLGPMRFDYAGSVRIAEQDAGARRAVLAGNARETRGQGAAEGRVTVQVGGGSDHSVVTAELEADLSGRAAQMGQGVVESVGRELTRQMASCLEGRLAPTQPDEGSGAPRPVGALPLLLQTLRSWFRRLLRRR
jgi:carbon monoxide dehydrogenase subunit G